MYIIDWNANANANGNSRSIKIWVGGCGVGEGEKWIRWYSITITITISSRFRAQWTSKCRQFRISVFVKHPVMYYVGIHSECKWMRREIRWLITRTKVPIVWPCDRRHQEAPIFAYQRSNKIRSLASLARLTRPALLSRCVSTRFSANHRFLWPWSFEPVILGLINSIPFYNLLRC